jgi:type I restriction enzyme S subunit
MTTRGWKPIKLDELGFVGRGRSRCRPRNEPTLYGGNYPFFQTGDIKAANLYLYNYSQTYNEKGLAQSKLWQPGTLCITIAANIAETAILGIAGCFPDSVVGFIADPDKADVRFIKYFIDTIKIQMQSISRGTTQDNLSLDKLLSFDILTPPLSIQRKIATILSSYDDLIEKNTRRIKILEEMVQTIYLEWFVRYRFPGHEGVKVVETELGEAPDGWEVRNVGEISKLFRGKSYRSEDLADKGGYPFLNLKCIDRDGGFRRDGIKRFVGDYKEENIAMPGDIIIALTDMTQERRIVARSARVPDIGEKTYVMSMDVIKIAPEKNIDRAYLYAMLRYSSFPDNVKQHANGVNVLHLNPDRIRDFAFILPTKRLQEQYGKFAENMLSQIDLLSRQNDVLIQARDLLLPKLISGELDVSELNITESLEKNNH